MDKLFERLNLYDILAMICPGGLLLLAILSSGKMWTMVKAFPWMQHILTQSIVSKAFCIGCLGLLFAYLLGIMLHAIVTIWRAIWEDRKCSIWKFALWLCYKNEIVKSKKDDERIDESKYIFKLLNGVEWTTLKDVDAKKLQRAYFEAHSVARKSKGDTILTIEQQVAMLRNSFVPCVLLGIIALCNKFSGECSLGWWIALWVAICLIFSIFIIWAREYKLFAIVLSTYNLK